MLFAQLYSSSWTHPLHLTSSAMTYSSTDLRRSSALHVPGSICICPVVKLSQHSSAIMPCDLGDVASVGELINSFVVSYHHFANDLQVFVAMDHGCCQHNTTSSFDRLPCCSDAVRQCFLENHLQLNADKSDVMIQNTSAQLKSTAAITTIHVAGSPLPVASQIKSLGVIIDSYLCFNRQAAAIANKCKYHIHCVQKKTSTFDLFITLRTRT